MKKIVTLFSMVLLTFTGVPISSYASADSENGDTELKTVGAADNVNSSKDTENSINNNEITKVSDDITAELYESESNELMTEKVEYEDNLNALPTDTSQTQNEIQERVFTDQAITDEYKEITEETLEINNQVASIDSVADSSYFIKNSLTQSFINKISAQAQKISQENDLFTSVVIAQAVLESGSGSSQLSQEPYNNLFGIKGSYEGQYVVLPTQEEDSNGNFYQVESAFRQYPSIKESLEDYGQLIASNSIYQSVHKSVAQTYENATLALTGTYATDSLYNQKLNEVIQTYNLTQYDYEKNEKSSAEFIPYDGINYDVNNSYAAGNCTQYVYNRITQLGGVIDLNIGNAQEWGVTGQARGFEVTNTPKAGTAVSFSPGILGADLTYGHVAFVEHINNGTHIEIIQELLNHSSQRETLRYIGITQEDKDTAVMSLDL